MSLAISPSFTASLPVRPPGASLALIAAWLLAACAPVSRVILLPEDSHPGSQVVVSTYKADMTIDRPYGVAKIGRLGGLSADTTSADEVAAEFPRLLALRPAPPERFTLRGYEYDYAFQPISEFEQKSAAAPQPTDAPTYAVVPEPKSAAAPESARRQWEIKGD